MSQQGPFDRILNPRGDGAGPNPPDSSARLILLAFGAVGVLLLILVLSPLSLFGGGDGSNDEGLTTALATSAADGNVRLPNVPEGLEALSKLFTLEKPEGQGPYVLTLNLAKTQTDGRNLGLYTNRNGQWERVAGATLVNNGTAVTGQVDQVPSNLAILRRLVSAVEISGWVAAGAQADSKAMEVLSTVNPLGLAPAADGSLVGTLAVLGNSRGNTVPAIRATTAAESEAVRTILSTPSGREAHVNALVQLSLQSGNTGIEIDYPQVSLARKADFTSFISLLAERLHQSNRTLSVALPLPVKSGANWDTGAYDWPELSRHADRIKLAGEPDPSIYFTRMTEVLEYLKSRVDLKKVSLVISRFSKEKGSDGLRILSLHEGLDLASDIEVRTSTQITPNSSVVIVGKNIFQDDGASGLHWDENASAVSFTYPGRGGQRTVWLENSLSIAFKLDLAKRYGLGGITIDDVSDSPQMAAVWTPLAKFAESGNIDLVEANSTMLRPTWQVQAGGSEPGTKGNIVWKAPAQPGRYDVSLIVSDGVIRAAQKIVLEVAAPAGTPTNPNSPTAVPTARP